MPIIKPNGRGATPKGWRNVWGEFMRLQTIANKTGTPTLGWQIEVPRTLRGLFNPWQMHWNPPGSHRLQIAALGTNAEEAVETLRSLQTLYLKYMDESKTGERASAINRITSTAPPSPRKIPNPQTAAEINHNFNIDLAALSPQSGSLFDRPQTIEKYRDILRRIGPWAMRDNYPNMYNSIGRKKAGILNMDLHTYWSRTEMGRYYPIPPFNDAEVNARKQALQQMHEQQAADASTQEDDTPINYEGFA